MAMSIRGARGPLRRTRSGCEIYTEELIKYQKRGAGTNSPLTRIGDPQALP